MVKAPAAQHWTPDTRLRRASYPAKCAGVLRRSASAEGSRLGGSSTFDGRLCVRVPGWSIRQVRLAVRAPFSCTQGAQVLPYVRGRQPCCAMLRTPGCACRRPDTAVSGFYALWFTHTATRKSTLRTTDSQMAAKLKRVVKAFNSVEDLVEVGLRSSRNWAPVAGERCGKQGARLRCRQTAGF